MVLQVGAHSRYIPHHVYAMSLEQTGRADARELQQLRRADRAGAQDDLGGALHRQLLAAPAQHHAAAARLARRVGLEHQPLGDASRSRPADWRGWRIGRRKALDAFQRQPSFWLTSKNPTPWLSPVLKSSLAGMPASVAAAANASQHLPVQALLVDPPFATVAVQFGEAAPAVAAGRRRRRAGNGLHGP